MDAVDKDWITFVDAADKQPQTTPKFLILPTLMDTQSIYNIIEHYMVAEHYVVRVILSVLYLAPRNNGNTSLNIQFGCSMAQVNTCKQRAKTSQACAHYILQWYYMSYMTHRVVIVYPNTLQVLFCENMGSNSMLLSCLIV